MLIYNVTDNKVTYLRQSILFLKYNMVYLFGERERLTAVNNNRLILICGYVQYLFYVLRKEFVSIITTISEFSKFNFSLVAS